MKKFLVAAIVILATKACTSKVEIPSRHVGVIKNREQVNAKVLRPGAYSVEANSEIIIYDVSPASLDIEFDFLFSDASDGNLKVAIKFNPIADSLSSFYREFQTSEILLIVDEGTRRAVRNLLLNYSPAELTKDELSQKISEAITKNHILENYVDINRVDIVELKF